MTTEVIIRAIEHPPLSPRIPAAGTQWTEREYLPAGAAGGILRVVPMHGIRAALLVTVTFKLQY
jgi:hypothetical protein